MKPIVIIIFVSLFVSSLAGSRELSDFLKPEGEHFEYKKPLCSHFDKKATPLYDAKSQIDRRPYDVLFYDVYLDWYELMLRDSANGEERYWSGINIITVEIDSSEVEALEFDADGMRADSVFVDGVKIEPNPEIRNRILAVELPATFEVGETAQIKIHYTYVNDRNVGFFLYPKDMFVGENYRPPYDSIFVEERLAYTLTEPEGSRFWMPCNDRPYDKADYKISVRVPDEFQVASNGLLLEIDSTSQDGRTYVWGDGDPIPTYLTAVAASKFVVFKDTYTRVTDPSESIEVINYVWRSDYERTEVTDGSHYNARHALRNVVPMMEEFSRVLGEYPFKKYGHVAVQPTWTGGMEHQTMTLINRSWLRGADVGIAHELGHHWFGDLITCATWKDIWINEGGATWTELIYIRDFLGEESVEENLLYKKEYYLRKGGLDLRPIYNPPMGDIFNTALTYYKSSWIYHMLNEALGDDKFYETIFALLDEYAYNSLETKDFARFFEDNVENSPISISKFFDQWVYGAGHPVYEIFAYPRFNNSLGYDLHVNLRQIQDAPQVAEVFETPVRFNIYGPEGIVVKKTGINLEREQEFVFDIAFIPDSVEIDEMSVLCEVADEVLSVSEKSVYEKSSPFARPNPVRIGETCSVDLSLTSPGFVRADLFDNLGSVVKTAYEGDLRSGEFTIDISTRGLSQGVYYLKIQTSAGVETVKVNVVN